MRGACLLLLALLGGCARLDVRELIPPAAMAQPIPDTTRVGVALAPLAGLPMPPELSSGPGSWLPEPLGGFLGSVPLLSSFLPAPEPPWLRHARRQDALSPTLAATLIGRSGEALHWRRPLWMLSEEAGLMAQARERKLDVVLVIRASVGPEDDGEELPGRMAAAADVALLDARAGTTLARGYDRITLRVEGRGLEALPRTLRRAGRLMGQRLRASLRTGAGAEEDPAEGDDEDY